MAPHLPRAVTGSPENVRDIPEVERRFWFLQASARACYPSRHAWAAGRESWRGPSEIEQAAAVRMIARGCARERSLGRGSACGGGIQRSTMASLLNYPSKSP